MAALFVVLAFLAALAMPATGLGASLKAWAGGDRQSGNSALDYASGLAGVTFEQRAHTTEPGGWNDLCTTTGNGECTSGDFPNGSNLNIRVGAAPSGWSVLQELSFGGANSYVGQATPYWAVRSGAGAVNTRPAQVNVGTSSSYDLRATSRGINAANNQTDTAGVDRFILRRDNPSWPNSCDTRVRIRLVLDRSGSVRPYEATFRAAAQAMVESLRGQPVTLELWQFASTAGAVGEHDLSTTAGANAASSQIATQYTNVPSNGYTNWDEALWGARASSASVVILLTDGNPTTTRGGTTNSTVQQRDVTMAIASSNLVKAGTAGGPQKRVVTVGAGANVNVPNLKALSGDMLNQDYFLATNLDDLKAELEKVAGEICGARVHVKKVLDGAAAPGWDFTGSDAATEVSVVHENGTKSTTANDGTTRITLNNLPPTGTTLKVAETAKPGVTFTGATCARGTSDRDFPSTGEATGNNPFTTGVINRNEDWYCTFVNTRDTGALTITKTVTGDVPSGFAQTFTFDIACTKPGDTNLNYPDLTIAYPTATTVTRSDIPTGYVCTVTEETPETVADHTWGTATIGGAVTIAKNSQGRVGVTNPLSRDTGKLEVTKVLNPATDPGTFNLSAQGPTPLSATGVGNGGTTGADGTTVETGEYTIGESAAAGTDLADYTAATVCHARDDRSATNLLTDGRVTVARGDDVLCVITNSRIPDPEPPVVTPPVVTPPVPTPPVVTPPVPTPPVVTPPPAAEVVGTPVPPLVAQVNPRLHITKTGPARARGLQRITYTIRVRNTGTVVARNVVLTDRLPRDLTFVRTSLRSTFRSGTVTVKLGTLRPRQSRVVRITVRAPADIRGRRVNTAQVRAAQVRPISARATTTFRPLVRRIAPAVTG